MNTPRAATNAAADLVTLASLAAGNGQVRDRPQEGRPRLPRQEIIRRSKELMEERDGEPIHLDDLAAAAKVSERTLRTAFHEYFGVGPGGYLQLQQLHQIYRALRAADPEGASVSEILFRHGVWRFSRFAARYRRLFGERPSQTLRKESAVTIYTGPARTD